MSASEPQWWGMVDFHNAPPEEVERRLAEVRGRVEGNDDVVVVASETGHIALRWHADDREQALQRIHASAGVNPEDFAPGHRQAA
jgi:hypothetical protein